MKKSLIEISMGLTFYYAGAAHATLASNSEMIAGVIAGTILCLVGYFLLDWRVRLGK